MTDLFLTIRPNSLRDFINRSSHEKQLAAIYTPK